MAIIGKIRQRSTLLLIFVGVALLAFIVGDKFMRNFFDKQDYDPQTIAKIDGEKVPASTFYQKVEEYTENMKAQQKKDNLSQEESYQLMLQVWDGYKKEFIIDREAEKIGLLENNGEEDKPAISMTEFSQMMQGDYPHSFIQQNFTDPKTGKFNNNGVVEYLNNLENMKKSSKQEEREQAFKAQTQWDNIIAQIKKDRVVEKYNALLAKSYYMPRALAAQDYKEKNTGFSIRYAYINYNTIDDKTIKPTDADYNAYYEEHKNMFENKEESRLMDYVVWNVTPSAEDINAVQTEVQRIKDEMAVTPNEEMMQYAIRNTDTKFDTNWIAKGKLPVYIDSLAFSSNVGTSFGPWVDNQSIHLAKLMDIQVRPDSLRASHILISYSGAQNAAETVTRTKVAAKELADSLLKVIKANPNSFENYAASISDDAAAKQKMGDLDWFVDGMMIPEFTNAVLKGNVGDFVIVETVFGEHIVKITGKKALIKKVKVAMIDKKMTFSEETYNKAFGQANKFASMTDDSIKFEKNTTDMQLQIMHSGPIKAMDPNIPGMSNSRSAIKWAFNPKTEVGNVSEILAYEDKICVAVLKKINKKGFSSMEDVKDYIKPLVIRDLKAKTLMEKNKNAGSDINVIAMNNKIMVDTSAQFTFAAYSLPKCGPEPNVQGRIFAMQPNKLYGPLKGDQGVYFVIVDSKSEAAPNNDNYLAQRQQAQMMFSQQRVNGYDKYGEAYKALEDKTIIDDFRLFFY